MAFIGLPFYGYCPYDVTTDEDGTETEVPKTGKLTRSVISFSASASSEATELWAGDMMEQSDYGVPSGTVTISRSYLSLDEEAEICGNTLSEDGELLHKDTDKAPYLKLGSMAKLKDPSRKVKYRVVIYMRGWFGPVSDEYNTAQKQPAFTTPSLSGSVTVNAKGEFRKKKEFDKYEEALAYFKQELNIAGGGG